jgi:hypothetical protein
VAKAAAAAATLEQEVVVAVAALRQSTLPLVPERRAKDTTAVTAIALTAPQQVVVVRVAQVATPRALVLEPGAAELHPALLEPL